MDGPLNPGTLESLKACADPDDPGFLAEIVGAYLSDALRRLGEIRTAFAQGDASQLGRLAHTVKGSSLNIGADRLASLMHALEREGKLGTLPAPERLDEAEAEFARVKAALSGWAA